MAEDRRFLLLRHPVAVGFTLLVVFGVLHALAQAMAVLLLGFLAILLATLLCLPIDLLARITLRPFAFFLTMLLVVGLIAALAAVAVPILSEQATRFGEHVPMALSHLSDWWAKLKRSNTLPALHGQGLLGRLADEAQALVKQAVPLVMSVGSALFTGFLVFVLALALAYAPATYVTGVRSLVPHEHEALLDETVRRMGTTLRRWVGGILAQMLTMGLLASLGLAIVGVDGWLLLGLLTFLGTFVPYLGAIASAVPALLVGLAHSPTQLLWVLVVYVIVHIFEGYVVAPLVMRRAVLLRPGLLLFWQLLAGAVFGLPGIVVATPLLACAQTAVDFLWVERRLGKTAT